VTSKRINIDHPPRSIAGVLCRGLLLLTLLGGCASPVFTPGEVSGTDRSVSFRDLSENPEGYVGRHVVLGGVIMSVVRQGIVGTVAVRERPLGEDYRPDMEKPSRGVFLVRTDEPLSEDFYRAGRKIEVVGRVLKPEWQKDADGKKVLVPVLRARAIHVETPPHPGPAGIYMPYYYPGWFYPYGPMFF
jgi:outer membrane lipoprotein